MVDVRFELTTNDPWSVDDAICEGTSPLGYWNRGSTYGLSTFVNALVRWATCKKDNLDHV